MSQIMGGEVPYCCGGVHFPPDYFPILKHLLMPHPESNSSVEYLTMLLNIVMSESSMQAHCVSVCLEEGKKGTCGM